MAKHVFLGLTTLCFLVIATQSTEHSSLALPYAFFGIASALISGYLYGKDS